MERRDLRAQGVTLLSVDLTDQRCYAKELFEEGGKITN